MSVYNKKNNIKLFFDRQIAVYGVLLKKFLSIRSYLM